MHALCYVLDMSKYSPLARLILKDGIGHACIHESTPLKQCPFWAIRKTACRSADPEIRTPDLPKPHRAGGWVDHVNELPSQLKILISCQ